MKYLLLILTFVSLSAFAKATIKVDEVQALEKKFLALNYANKSDWNKGVDMTPLVWDQYQNFYDTYKTDAKAGEHFSALIRLLASSIPFEEDPEGAQRLMNLILESKLLRATYNTVAPRLPDTCRRELLQTTVNEQLCQNGEKNKCSNKIFNYEQCAGIKSAE